MELQDSWAQGDKHLECISVMDRLYALINFIVKTPYSKQIIS